MFVARAVATGRTLRDPDRHYEIPLMPELFPAAKKLYVEAWGEEVYDRYKDDVSVNRWHGGVHKFPTHIPNKRAPTRRRFRDAQERKKAAPPEIPFAHQPYHDVESVGWSLVVISLGLCPLGQSDLKRTEPDVLMHIWETFQSHRIGHSHDLRDNLSWDEGFVQRALHPGLFDLAGLITDILRQIRPEYAVLEDAPRDHLHEVFRRLLLDFIVDMGDDDIALDPQHFQYHPEVTSSENETKRAAEGDPETSVHSNKRVRT